MAEPPAPAQPLVFLSHVSEDHAVAMILRRALETDGYRIYMAPEDVTAATPWQEQIAAAITGCDVLLILISRRATSSEHVQREVSLAMSSGKPLLPVRLERLALSGALAYLLQLTQWVDAFPPPVDRHAAQIAARVAQLLGRADARAGALGPTTPALPVAGRVVQLPTPLDTIIGRAPDVAAVTSLLKEHRLVTITGTGGVGKTRVAIEVAASVAGRQTKGTWFVDLAPIRDADLVLGVIAEVIGAPVEGATDAGRRVERHLAGGSALLLLDNFEQVIDAAPAIGRMLASSPDIRAIVTSRAPLRIRGEREYPLEPLATAAGNDEGALVDREGHPALAMLADRCAAVGRPIGKGDLGVATRICQRLGGLPLAIELAAARARTVSLAEVEADLVGGRDRTGQAPRDIPERQKSLDAMIDWSRGLLPRRQRDLFDLVSLFVAPFDPTAATAISGADDADSVIADLSGIVESGLLQQHVDDGGHSRFRMLEPVREAAARRVSGPRASRAFRRVLRHWREVTEAAEAGVHGADQVRWSQRIAFDVDNIRSAVSWASSAGTSADAVEAMAAVCSLGDYLSRRGWAAEAADRLEGLLSQARSDVPPEARLRALLGIGASRLDLEDHQAAARHLDEALHIARRLGDHPAQAKAENNIALARGLAGDTSGMREHLERAIDLYREGGDEWGAAGGLGNLGICAFRAGDLDAAEEWFVRARAAFAALGDPLSVALADHNLGLTFLAHGDGARAVDLIASAIAVAEQSGSVLDMRIDLARATLAAERSAEYERLALPLIEQVLGAGSDHLTVQLLDVLARGAKSEDRVIECAVIIGVAESIRRRHSWATAPHDREWLKATSDELVARLGREMLEECLERGRASEPDAVLRQILAQYARLPSAGTGAPTGSVVPLDRA